MVLSGLHLSRNNVNNREKGKSAEYQVRAGAFDMPYNNKDVDTEDDESDHLSDIDDIEVNEYLSDKKEINYKKIIWERMNKEYLQEQEARKAAVNMPKISRSRKERQQKHTAKATSALTTDEHQMLIKKRLSTKINYDVLDKLFGDDDMVPDSKKSKTCSGNEDTEELAGESEDEHNCTNTSNLSYKDSFDDY